VNAPDCSGRIHGSGEENWWRLGTRGRGRNCHPGGGTDLRHAHASWLLAGGADLKTVMDRLGHAQIQTTQKYLHTLPDADDQAMDAFKRIRSRGLHT
jgi:integrase